jgi:hypothetical protein
MRELKSDFSLIRDPNMSRHGAYDAFKRAMAGREYGQDPLNAAWVWFRDGWDARTEEQST